VQPASPHAEDSWRRGARESLPFAAASFVLSVSFGVVAVEAGFSPLAAVIMSAVVYGGAGQFALVGILGAGGGLGAAVGAAALVNGRFVPMGFALGPSLRGGPVQRALEGQTSIDVSWAMAARGDGSFGREYLFGHSAVQYVAWVGGTLTGVLAPAVDARALGLDVIFPAFFLALLVKEVRDGHRLTVAVLAAVIALVLVPVLPPGGPVLVASVAALLGLRRQWR
jgi:predicted branched-subunit amino acid permease